MMELKRLQTDWQQIEGKIIAGWASTEQLDADNDIIRASAFEQTLGRYLNNPVLLWQHNWQSPIGRVTSARVEPGRGLYIEAQLSDTTLGRDAQTLLLDSVIRDMSIGFQVKEFRPLDSGREITQLELYEISLVTIGANPSAEVDTIKHQPQGRPHEAGLRLNPALVARRIKQLGGNYEH